MVEISCVCVHMRACRRIGRARTWRARALRDDRERASGDDNRPEKRSRRASTADSGRPDTRRRIRDLAYLHTQLAPVRRGYRRGEHLRGGIARPRAAGGWNPRSGERVRKGGLQAADVSDRKISHPLRNSTRRSEIHEGVE